MLQNNMICSKQHNFGTDVLFTSKLSIPGKFVMSGLFIKKLSGCCKMLQNNMICSKQYNLESNAFITSKLGTKEQFVMWSRFRQEPFSRIIRLLQYAAQQYDLQQMAYFGNQSLDYFQTLYAEIVYHVEQIEIGVFFKKLSGCCEMLQKKHDLQQIS